MAISTEEMRARQEAAQGESTSIAQAIQEVSERAQLLVREEIELARAEVTAKVSQLVKGAAIGAAAGIFVIVGLLFVLHGFAWLAYYALPVPDGAFFWGFFLVAGILFLLGALAGFIAAKAFKRGSPPTPELAIDEAKRIRETVTSDRPEQTI
jgi:putative superfamily III holin-X